MPGGTTESDHVRDLIGGIALFVIAVLWLVVAAIWEVLRRLWPVARDAPLCAACGVIGVLIALALTLSGPLP